jgi:hypothetical protein
MPHGKHHMTCYEDDVNKMADPRAVNITWLNSGPAMLYKRAEAVSTPESSLVSCRERVFRIQKSEYLGRAPVNRSWSVSRVAQLRVYSEAAVFTEELQVSSGGEQILWYWKTGNQWRHSEETQQVLWWTVVSRRSVYTVIVTVCDLINPVVNPIPVLYSRHIHVTI